MTLWAHRIFQMSDVEGGEQLIWYAQRVKGVCSRNWSIGLTGSCKALTSLNIFKFPEES
jgi:hypothetical protein